MIEMEKVKLTESECIEIVAKYVGLSQVEMAKVIGTLIKIGVISEYVFQQAEKK